MWVFVSDLHLHLESGCGYDNGKKYPTYVNTNSNILKKLISHVIEPKNKCHVIL